MQRSLPLVLAAALALAGAACTDSSAPAASDALSAAFNTLPYGYELAPNTFAGTTIGGAEWVPELNDAAGHRGPGDRGHGGGPGMGTMMCGGLGGGFGGGILGIGFGRGFFGGVALEGTCAFNATSQRVECDTIVRHGLSIVKSAAYSDAVGAVQQAFDNATTNTINLRVTVAGTVLRRRGDTATVHHASDRTVSGLAPGSTERTINGSSAGTEHISGANHEGAAFTADREVGDTITGVVIPVRTTGVAFPTAGHVIRSASVTVTIGAGTPETSTRREVITYDGSNTAKIEITENGTTRTCTMALPHGRLVCQ